MLPGESSREAWRDFCDPMFYFSKDLDDAWLLGRINRASERCPTIAHGAEENGSTTERWFNQVLSWIGAAPPYYRFLPMFLRLPPLPALPARNTNVGLTASEHRR